MTKQLIKIAHSPDSDDAFMFWALQNGKLYSEKYEFEIVRRDIEELNHEALKETYDITAVSMHAYAYVADKYALLSSGASMAEKDYGPMVVSKQNHSRKDLKKITVAVPGEWTTAFLVLKMIEPKIQHKVLPFEEIMPAVLEGRVDAGLIIHEGQLEYERLGLKKIVSLIEYWKEKARELPLPLGGNAVKKSLGPQVMKELSDLQRQSIQCAMDHFIEARDYAVQFKRDISREEADLYLSWYANDRTLDMGDAGREAISLLFKLAIDQGLINNIFTIDIV